MCVGSPDIPPPPPPPAIPQPPQEQSASVSNARDAARRKGNQQNGFASTILSDAGGKNKGIGVGGESTMDNSFLSSAGKRVGGSKDPNAINNFKTARDARNAGIDGDIINQRFGSGGQ